MPQAAKSKEKPPGKAAPPLTGRQLRHLRGLGHHLDPVVHVGKEGVSDALVAAAGAALLDHELIKLRLHESVEEDRHEVARQLAERCGAQLVQVLGRTVLLYRRRPESDKRPHLPLSPAPGRGDGGRKSGSSSAS